jgi:hypothetical protein
VDPFHKHVSDFFTGHRVGRRDFDRGPIQKVAPGFHALSIGPGPRTKLWSYVSVGGALVTKPGRPVIEFLVMSEQESDAMVERLAMTVYYHHRETLGVGHTYPFGKPWVDGSTLDHVLVSRPYPFGPALESFPLADGGHGRLLWLVPITAAERKYKIEHGLDALETLFDRANLEYWNTSRLSLV